MMQTHEIWMRRCLQLAGLGKGLVAPNPMVGAVLVHKGRILSEGYHARYGERHAEAMCLDNLRPEDRPLLCESTMYVNLEPCSHVGKQPPCAGRLVREEVGRIVACNSDPFSAVSGRGFQLLSLAGIPYQKGVLEEEGRWLNRRFFTFQEQQRPYIILKWAQTADGFMAPTDRSRTAISGPLAKVLVHRWRTEESAILIGKATALFDDPELTAREWSGPQPLRLVLDSSLSLPAHLKLFNGSTETWQLNHVKDEVLPTHRRVKLPVAEGSLPALLQMLYNAGKQSLIVEGGAAILRSFLAAGLWDEIRLLRSQKTFGQGIAVPPITRATLAFESAVGPDMLSLYLPRELPFPYPAGSLF